MTLQQVFTALGRGNANAGGSYIEQGEQQYLIRGIGLLRSADDIGNIVVAEHGGTPILIRDIADVDDRRGAAPGPRRPGRRRRDRDRHRADAQRREPVRGARPRVKERVDAAERRRSCRKGVTIVPFYDRTWLIDTTLTTVFKNLLEGALLVTSCCISSCGNLRAAGDRRASIIPLSLLATFIGLHHPRHPGEPAVARRDGLRHHRRRRGHRASRTSSGASAAHETAATIDARAASAILRSDASRSGRPTLFSMLIIIIAHIPIFTLQRHEGRIFAPMAYTVVSALIGSLLFSLTLVPLLCSASAAARACRDEDNSLVRVCKRALSAALLGARCAAPTVVIGGAVAGCWRQPGAGAAAGQRVPARTERRRHLGQHHAAAGDLGHARRRGSARACARCFAQFPEVRVGDLARPGGRRTAPIRS